MSTFTISPSGNSKISGAGVWFDFSSFINCFFCVYLENKSRFLVSHAREFWKSRKWFGSRVYWGSFPRHGSPKFPHFSLYFPHSAKTRCTLAKLFQSLPFFYRVDVYPKSTTNPVICPLAMREQIAGCSNPITGKLSFSKANSAMKSKLSETISVNGSKRLDEKLFSWGLFVSNDTFKVHFFVKNVDDDVLDNFIVEAVEIQNR